MKCAITNILICLGVCFSVACSTPNGGGGKGAFFLPDVKGGSLSGSDGTSGEDGGILSGGECDGSCPGRANATGTCTDGQCVYACKQGFLDCDGKVETGCEVDSTSNSSHCGTCDLSCSSGPNSTPTCVNSTCSMVCDGEGQDVDGNPTHEWMDCDPGVEGCETHVTQDASHCGSCTKTCEGGPNASPMCSSGTCGLHCNAGFADCDLEISSGCEIDTQNDPQHCGSCKLTCDSQCVKGACACASTSETATLIPLDLFIMMDKSGSMKEKTGTGASKWTAVSQAITSFVNSPNSAGIGVGIQYFAIEVNDVWFGTTESCTTADYAKPEVAIGALPANAAAIVSSIGSKSPSGATPTYPALQGAIQYAKSYAVAHPTHTVVVVLATDGEPNSSCDDNMSDIANLSLVAAAGKPKILTFVIGVGSSLSNLNSIAASGGTTSAFVLDTGGNVVTQFEAALKAIQGKALGCQYAIPKPSDGKPVDYDKVNLQLTAAGGPSGLTLYVDNVGACNATTGGWYYDNAAAPTKILLCPASCNLVTADKDAKVEILLGCSRETGSPP